ncbi:hypothetical protein [Streptomyces sp. NPDC127114]|uniref:hypothetical protein n=1 Tax=Streptomyces sp. NPDC127114 TaxID=3345366 RepID=UPI003645D216
MSTTGASAGADQGASAGALHRLVVFGDVVGSGRLGMDGKRLARAAMYEAFGEAYASVGIEPGTVHQEDRGDGILAALRPDVPPALMVGRWIDTLYESLRAHNGRSRGRLRLRVGMNAGLVLDDGRGLVGRAVDLACRLCDSAPARRVMADAPDVDLLIVVSDWLYRNVVVEGGRYVEPDHYRRAAVVAKETAEDAWFHVPRLPEPPLAPRTGGGPSRGDGSPPGTPAPRPSPRPPSGPPADVSSRPSSRLSPKPPSSPSRAPAGNRTYTAGRDIQVIEGNTIHGGFTGIRNDVRNDVRNEVGNGVGNPLPDPLRDEVPEEDWEPDWDEDQPAEAAAEAAEKAAAEAVPETEADEASEAPAWYGEREEPA